MNEPESAAPTVVPMQFDRAVRVGEAAPSTRGAVCARCRSAIVDQYFTIQGTPVCGGCKRDIEEDFAKTNTSRAFGRALVFGLGAAIAGAAIYYAVIALLNLQIGIVAILIGYMVGRAIQQALGGASRGGRRYQILAAALTYWAVGLAYVPLIFQAAREAPLGGLMMSFALPVIMIVSTLPSGLLSAFIILLGIRQAWRMTGGVNHTFVGPLRVAPIPPQADSSSA